jgi:hypothetical protein
VKEKQAMKRRSKSFPDMLTELSIASWQTMAYRTGLILAGQCTEAEYRTMLSEKFLAAQQSALAAMLPSANPEIAILAPWHRAASANARRLRRRKR